MLLRETQPPFTGRSWGPYPCSNCGRPMQLARNGAHTGGISAVVSYGCAECGIWMTESTDTQSRETIERLSP
jgi:DNA-directed RNA polymerase subunit RPC12/RpoP